MKSLQAPNLKTIALTKALYTAIRRNVDEAFDDISEESEKKHFERFIVDKPLRPVPSQDIVEQAEQNGELRPRGLTRGLTKDDALIKDK